MGYSSGYHRNAAKRKTDVPESERRRGDGERILFAVGILAVAASLALPVSRTRDADPSDGTAPEYAADPRAAVAVMSTAAEGTEMGNAEDGESLSAAAAEEESVFDGIGRFFAKLITGG